MLAQATKRSNESQSESPQGSKKLRAQGESLDETFHRQFEACFSDNLISPSIFIKEVASQLQQLQSIDEKIGFILKTVAVHRDTENRVNCSIPPRVVAFNPKGYILFLNSSTLDSRDLSLRGDEAGAGIVRLEYLYMFRDLLLICFQNSQNWTIRNLYQISTPRDYVDPSTLCHVLNEEWTAQSNPGLIPESMSFGIDNIHYHNPDYDSLVHTALADMIKWLDVHKGESHSQSRQSNGVWVTGNPGIGKSLFLTLLGLIRLLVGAPTLFLERSAEPTGNWKGTYFDGSEVRVFQHGTYYRGLDFFPRNMWVLIDCPDASDNVPAWVNTFIAKTSAFHVIASTNTVIDTASNQTTIAVHRWFMKPATLNELIMMRQFQSETYEAYPEAQIKEYIDLALPIPRIIFADCAAQTPPSRRVANAGAVILDIVSRFNLAALQRVLMTTAGCTRAERYLDIHGSLIQEELWKASCKLNADEITTWYTVFNYTPDSHCLNGPILERIMHRALRGGETFTLYQMTKEVGDVNLIFHGSSPTKSCQNPPSKPKFFKLKRTLSHPAPQSSVDTYQLQTIACPSSVNVQSPPLPEPLWTKSFRQKVYYQPLRKNCAFFDSLQVTGKKEATLFQCSVRERKESTDECLRFLKRHFESITYVYVHEAGKRCHLYLPQSFEDILGDRVYEMVLDEETRKKYIQTEWSA